MALYLIHHQQTNAKQMIVSKILLFFLFFIVTSLDTVAQKQETDPYDLVNIADLPEYIVITSESTGRLIGRKLTVINSEDSKYQLVLEALEDLLSNKKKLGIQNQTDLLNAMSKIGFDYVNAFNVGQ